MKKTNKKVIKKYIVNRGDFSFDVFINEAKGVVVAKCTSIDFFNPNLPLYAKATCNPTDTFDPRKGIAIAVDRALFKLLDRRIKYYQKEVNNLVDNSDKLFKCGRFVAIDVTGRCPVMKYRLEEGMMAEMPPKKAKKSRKKGK